MFSRNENELSAARPESLALHGSRLTLEIEARVPSEIKFIWPLLSQITRLIRDSQCAVGSEHAVELALQEALANAVIHGNGLNPDKQIQVHCRCDADEGVFLVVRDQGQGFDPAKVPDPLAPERLNADHGRGLHIMKAMMDEVRFEHGGTEIHLRKRPARDTDSNSRRFVLEIQRS